MRREGWDSPAFRGGPSRTYRKAASRRNENLQGRNLGQRCLPLTNRPALDRKVPVFALHPDLRRRKALPRLTPPVILNPASSPFLRGRTASFPIS